MSGGKRKRSTLWAWIVVTSFILGAIILVIYAKAIVPSGPVEVEVQMDAQYLAGRLRVPDGQGIAMLQLGLVADRSGDGIPEIVVVSMLARSGEWEGTLRILNGIGADARSDAAFVSPVTGEVVRRHQPGFAEFLHLRGRGDGLSCLHTGTLPEEWPAPASSCLSPDSCLGDADAEYDSVWRFDREGRALRLELPLGFERQLRVIDEASGSQIFEHEFPGDRWLLASPPMRRAGTFAWTSLEDPVIEVLRLDRPPRWQAFDIARPAWPIISGGKGGLVDFGATLDEAGRLRLLTLQRDQAELPDPEDESAVLRYDLVEFLIGEELERRLIASGITQSRKFGPVMNSLGAWVDDGVAAVFPVETGRLAGYDSLRVLTPWMDSLQQVQLPSGLVLEWIAGGSLQVIPDRDGDGVRDLLAFWRSYRAGKACWLILSGATGQVLKR